MHMRANAGEYIGTATLPCPFGSMRANTSVRTPCHARSGPCGAMHRCCHPTLHVWVNAGKYIGIAVLPCPFGSMRVNTSEQPLYHAFFAEMRANTLVLPPYNARPVK